MAEAHHAPADTGQSPSGGLTTEERKALMAQDSQAWHHVTGLLLTIVIGGLLLGILAVTISYFALGAW